MTDKEKIRNFVEEVFKINRKRSSIEGYAAVEQLRKVLAYIDSLPEESASKDLDEAAFRYSFERFPEEKGSAKRRGARIGFREGANWQKEQTIEKACEWWENELYYPSMTEQEVKWYKSKINKFRKEMSEHLNGIK